MSNAAQEQLARGLSVTTAVLVAASLLLVGWTLYRPQPAPPSTSQAEAAEVGP